jgi:hypothetical protein
MTEFIIGIIVGFFLLLFVLWWSLLMYEAGRASK